MSPSAPLRRCRVSLHNPTPGPLGQALHRATTLQKEDGHVCYE
jgi:hypothetical protein